MLLPLESEPQLITAASANFSLAESYAFCADLAQMHYENFPVASLLLPRRGRRHICAIYAFARVADDFADEPGRSTADRIQLLTDWESQLQRAYDGDAHHPVFIALSATVAELGLPIELFYALLAAFKQDVEVSRYSSFDEVLAYCRNSANPIGRLVLMVFGYISPDAFALSDDVCTALQLTNFWQDMSVDRKNDRLYLPLDDMARYNYSIDDWKSGTENEHFKALMQFQIERTEKLFEKGAMLPLEVKGRLSYELRCVSLGGKEILQQIKHLNYSLHTNRPVLRRNDKLRLLFRSLLTKGGGN